MRAKRWGDCPQDCQGPRQGWSWVRAAPRWTLVLGSLHRAAVLQAQSWRAPGIKRGRADLGGDKGQMALVRWGTGQEDCELGGR